MHKFQYNEEIRLKIQDPFKILKSIGLKEGYTFIDIGSNDGFFSVPASKIVGLNGKVYAIDIDSTAIERLKNKIMDNGINNIETVISEGENFLGGENIADIIFLGTVLHDFKDPFKVLQNSFSMLKNKGKLVDFDWKKKDTKMGPPLSIRLSETEAEELLKRTNFSDIKVQDISENFYQIIAFKN